MVSFVHHVKVSRGPLASVYYCPFCNDADGRVTVRYQRPASEWQRGPGRGFGFASASQARAKVTAHIKAKHPEAGREKT